MGTIFGLTMKSASRNPFLMIWSVLLPAGGTLVLGFWNGSPEYSPRIVVGMMAASILFFAFMTTSFTLLSQRKRGVYSLLKVTPTPLWKYTCAVAAAWTLTSLACAASVLLTGVLAFGLRVSPAAAAALTPLALFAATGFIFFGFFAAGLSRTENDLSIMTNAISMPMLFASDAFYSLDGAPVFLRAVSRFNPLQWLIDGMRAALDARWPAWLADMGLLALAAAAAFLLALWSYRFAEA